MDESSVPLRTAFKHVLGARLKAVGELFFPRSVSSMASFFLHFPRTTYNYAADVGDGLASSVVMPVVQWLGRVFPEAPVIVQQREEDDWETQHDHPLAKLLAQPNPYYSGAQLWMVTIFDWCWWGESYWRIMPARGGRPAELWWLPPWSCWPQWPADGSTFISHYTYGFEAQTMVELPVEEVIHFRHGLDPRNIRHGLSPLRAILQDIWTDQESANFIGSVMRNMGVPGIILSPKTDAGTVGPAEVERVKEYISSRFSGDNRGLPLALGAPTDVSKLAMTPSDLAVTDVRNTAEERVCAALGIPPAIVGFGTGLETTKVGATMTEMRKLAWQSGIIPVQRIMAQELNRTLLPWYEPEPDNWRVSWDYTEVQALQEDENEKAKRYQILVSAAIIKRSEAREALGYENDPEDEVYHLPINVTLEGPGAPEPDPPPALPPASPAAGVAPNGAGEPAPTNGSVGASRQDRGTSARGGLVRTPSARPVEQKQGMLDEWLTEVIGRHAQRMEKPPVGLRILATQILRQEKRLQPRFQQMVLKVLEDYGARAGMAAKEVFPMKASVDDMIRTAIVTERLPYTSVQVEMRQVYEQIGAAMAELILELYKEAMGLELTSDTRLRSMVQQGMTERVRLLDLASEAKDAVLRSLDEATQAGMGEDEIIRMIEARVPAGRWSSSEMRARVISRNESRIAANLATAQMASDSGINKALILDALLGPTDAQCELVNGWIVTPNEARALAQSEHVNGTRLIVAFANQGVAV